MLEILQPAGWVKPRGYANGVKARGTMIVTGGQVGWDAQCRFQSTRLADQVRQTLANIVAVLAEGGARPEHIIRLTWYVTDKREYLAAGREVGQAFRDIIGSYNAAMTAVEVRALIEDRAKVEIEATVVLPA